MKLHTCIYKAVPVILNSSIISKSPKLSEVARNSLCGTVSARLPPIKALLKMRQVFTVSPSQPLKVLPSNGLIGFVLIGL